MGVPEQTDGENKWESNECTVSQLVNNSREIGAKVEEQDTSVAHRLLSRSTGSKPIIACFSRRIAKISLRYTKSLDSKKNLKKVTIFKDMIQPRVNFIKNDDK